MGRLARSQILYDGCFAHVFSRSIEKREIFRDEEDFERFYGFLLKAKKKYKFEVYHYCLMYTHFHLVVRTNIVSEFSEALQRVKWDYTRWFNKKYKRWGPLWKERFKSLLIEDEKYLYACGMYVEENPVKAKLINRRQNWIYSSSRFYEEKSEDDLVDNYNISEQQLDGEEVDFERGSVIGTDLFKFKYRKGLL